MTKVLYNEEKKQVVDKAYINGYLILERELEGLPIGITIVNGKIGVFFNKKDESYLKKFNLSRIKKETIEFLEHFSDTSLSSTEDLEDEDVIITDH